MKIVIDARFYGHENGGLGRYTINLLRELAAIDHKNQYYVILRREYEGKLTLPDNFQEIIVDARHYSLSEQIILPLRLWRLKADLTHFLHFNVPIFARGKFIITIHDLLMHEGVGQDATTLHPLIFRIKRLAYRFVFDRAVERAYQIIVPSEYVKRDLEKWYPNTAHKSVVTYEGIDTKIMYVNSKHAIKKHEIKSPYFLYVGNAYPHKNLQTAIDALLLLNTQTRQKVTLVIITPKDIFAQRLSEYVRRKKALTQIHILGKVSDEELSEFYSHALAFVYPSLSEGFGLPALEAMSVGTPALVSDIEVFHEVYGSSARYFEATNKVSIAQAMKEILHESKKSREDARRIMQKGVSQYSWTKMAKEVLHIYSAHR